MLYWFRSSVQSPGRNRSSLTQIKGTQTSYHEWYRGPWSVRELGLLQFTTTLVLVVELRLGMWKPESYYMAAPTDANNRQLNSVATTSERRQLLQLPVHGRRSFYYGIHRRRVCHEFGKQRESVSARSHQRAARGAKWRHCWCVWKVIIPRCPYNRLRRRCSWAMGCVSDRRRPCFCGQVSVCGLETLQQVTDATAASAWMTDYTTLCFPPHLFSAATLPWETVEI